MWTENPWKVFVIDLCQHLTTCDFSFRGCHASLCREPWDALDSPYLHDPGPQKRGVKHQLQSLWRCRPTMFSSCFLASPMQDHHMRLSEPSQTHPIHCFPTGNTRLKTLIHALFPLQIKRKQDWADNGPALHTWLPCGRACGNQKLLLAIQIRTQDSFQPLRAAKRGDNLPKLQIVQPHIERPYYWTYGNVVV